MKRPQVYGYVIMVHDIFKFHRHHQLIEAFQETECGGHTERELPEGEGLVRCGYPGGTWQGRRDEERKILGLHRSICGSQSTSNGRNY